MARLSREAAITEMVNGGLLYVYVESEYSHQHRSPMPGSGAIVGDNGLSHVGQRTVRALHRLGTAWCDKNRAEVLSDAGKRRVMHGTSPIWFWQ